MRRKASPETQLKYAKQEIKILKNSLLGSRNDYQNLVRDYWSPICKINASLTKTGNGMANSILNHISLIPEEHRDNIKQWCTAWRAVADRQ